MELKNGVKVHGLSNEIMLAVFVCIGVYEKYGEELVITSITDGQHSGTSLHYSGNAIDIRTRYFDEKEIEVVAGDIRSRLTGDYDIVVEKTHIHIEYQPRYSE